MSPVFSGSHCSRSAFKSAGCISMPSPDTAAERSSEEMKPTPSVSNLEKIGLSSLRSSTWTSSIVAGSGAITRYGPHSSAGCSIELPRLFL